MPKQLLRLAGDRTMLQATLARCDPWIPAERTWIVTNRTQVDESAGQVPQVPRDQILIEPCGRNTAPCIGLAAIHLLARDPEAVMLVMPADHVIEPPAVFRAAVTEATAVVERTPEALVLFGVPPTHPATGYGYIERGAPLAGSSSKAFAVRSFREKPIAETAAQYVASGNFYWNCGIFVWRAERILAALEEFEPESHARLMRLRSALGTSRWSGLLDSEFPQMKSISIDYAVLERAAGVCVLEAPFQWDDVGSWQSLSRLLGQDDDHNTIDGPFCSVNTTGCIVRTSADHLVATIGLEDCIIVHTPDATLIARKDDENAVRQLVALLEERGYGRFL